MLLVLGVTASGKSRLGFELARSLAGEIVAGTAIELAGLLKDAVKPRKKP